jgi:3-hydroxyacyl-[acyl-carrier-protein] dehydratase
MIMNIEEIMNIIPHRYPFLLIDRIEEVTPGERAVGTKCVSINEPFFQGHFPGKPVMPGVLIIEALAQVGAVAILSLDEFKGKVAYFAGIDKAKFRRKVIPGDVLRLEVEIIKRRGPMGIGKAIAYVGDKKACEAELSFVIGLEE